MMENRTRRRFLKDVGKGMLATAMGSGLATGPGIPITLADDSSDRLTFGALEALVDLMQQTPLEKLQPLLIRKVKDGVSLHQLVAAGALANARCFAGEDYIGFHVMMALMPAWWIAGELPKNERLLPILKVLYRNTARIQRTGGYEEMRRIEPAKLVRGQEGSQLLLQGLDSGDTRATEKVFVALAQNDLPGAYNDLHYLVQEDPDVHGVVLAWRAWEVMQLTGTEYAQTLLRQSVRYCVDKGQSTSEPPLRELVPALLDKYKLIGGKKGTRKAELAWVEGLAKSIFNGSRGQAAEAAASALAEGFLADDIAEAMSLAANRLVLHDPGRSPSRASAEKPEGSVHGAGVGVHAADAANAWRNIARVTNDRNQLSSLIVGAWHTAGQAHKVSATPFPYDPNPIQAKKLDQTQLIEELDNAVQSRDQAMAMAVVRSYQLAGYPSKPVFDSLRGYAISEDGALHAEKYYRTVVEEFAATRREFRWQHLIGLARVSASEYGWAAPGQKQARELLQV
jgi:hypothetical protein